MMTLANREMVIDAYVMGYTPLQIARANNLPDKEVQMICGRYSGNTTHQRKKWLAKNGWSWKFKK